MWVFFGSHGVPLGGPFCRWSCTVSFHRAVLSERRRVISFALLRYMIDSHAFPRILRQLHVISSSFHWFTVLSVSFVID